MNKLVLLCSLAAVTGDRHGNFDKTLIAHKYMELICLSFHSLSCKASIFFLNEVHHRLMFSFNKYSHLKYRFRNKEVMVRLII